VADLPEETSVTLSLPAQAVSKKVKGNLKNFNFSCSTYEQLFIQRVQAFYSNGLTKA